MSLIAWPDPWYKTDELPPQPEPIGAGSAIAAMLREEVSDQDFHPGNWGKTECCDCGRFSNYTQDGRCDQCNGLVPEVEPQRTKEAIKSLCLRTAAHLRELGYPERAAWYEERAAEL